MRDIEEAANGFHDWWNSKLDDGPKYEPNILPSPGGGDFEHTESIRSMSLTTQCLLDDRHQDWS